MASSSPPRIFSHDRRLAARRRSRHMQSAPDAARYLLADMVDDVIDRLDFLRFEPRRALIVGDWTGELARLLEDRDIDVTTSFPEALDEDQPYPISDFDFIASLGTLDTVNDLPGALIHLRGALASGGLLIASFPGAGSLTTLRSIMLAADGDRPAPRIHPQVDVRAGGQLLQRAGFADPVIDSRTLSVSFRTLGALVADLRAQGLSNVLARPGPPLSREALQRASASFSAAGENGRTTESFEILTLSGWRR